MPVRLGGFEMSRQEFDQHVQGSISIASEFVASQLKWLGYVPDHEFTPAETRRLLAAMYRLASVAAKLNAKYVD